MPSAAGVLSPKVADAISDTFRGDRSSRAVPMFTRVIACSIVTEYVQTSAPQNPQPGATKSIPGPAGRDHSSVRRNLPLSTSAWVNSLV